MDATFAFIVVDVVAGVVWSEATIAGVVLVKSVVVVSVDVVV